MLINEYIHFYNNERIQLKTKQTPLENEVSMSIKN
ncbi:MAG: IS3 family transposase [Clostridia bacterium]|nr:IS3 family transposase [Clostridia bacterium]